MTLSTPAKIAIGLGVVGATGLGAYVFSRPRKHSEKDDNGAGMSRDDGTRPSEDQRPVVTADLEAALVESDRDGWSIDVGTRYDLPLPPELAAEFDEGRRFALIVAGKIVGGEPVAAKSWSIPTAAFDLQHDEMRIAFDPATKVLSISVDRAGRYALATKDDEGIEVWGDLEMVAT